MGLLLSLIARNLGNPWAGGCTIEGGQGSQMEILVKTRLAVNGDRKRALTLIALCAGAIAWEGSRQSLYAQSGDRPGATLEVSVRRAGTVLIKTPEAEFELLASGYLKGHLVKEGQRLTLDEPSPGDAEGGDLLVSGGAPVHFGRPDFGGVKISDIHGAIGPRGKRVELTSTGGVSLQKVLALEVYDNFPSVAFLTVAYHNTGTKPVKLDRISVQRRRLSATLSDGQALPYQMWSFQGSSYKWGQNDVMPVTKGFSLVNAVGPSTVDHFGGGLPVVAFWTRSVGMAIGHAEPRPYALTLPVAVREDNRVGASIRIDTGTVLKPGETYSTPRTFLVVFSGDYYEPLNIWSRILQRQGWDLAKPSSGSFDANWCGWGYLDGFTREQILGTITKIKEFGIKWATLDSGWFNNTGDWDPDPKKFPGDSLRRLVDEFHKNRIQITVWWQALLVDAGQGHRPGRVSKVFQEHPDWLILDANGRRGPQAMLCPALPAVQEYYRKVTGKLMRDFDFDGSKLDGIYSAPRCYNPAHHHKSPDDSMLAVADVYKIVFDTTQALKPDAVTQICPCGTTPNLAWLPFMNQAVTADPVGSVQVRRRIKLYKALLGPRSAVYGDHVELSKIVFAPGREIDIGEDFASTIGAGGVLGTKFTWPDYGPRFSDAFLTPRKEIRWQKWTSIYNSNMLSKGAFLNLYTIGYDSPEGYAIAKDGKTYYAFFAELRSPVWKGTLELRGLEPGNTVFTIMRMRKTWVPSTVQIPGSPQNSKST
jgi:alpha-galactosidase